MLITSTDFLEGYDIEEYLDLIIVNGAINIVDISEWLIGIQNANVALVSMENIKKKVISELINNAKLVKADAIIGFSIDFDQIGGKSGGMLMVSALGTPVRMKKRINDIFELAKKYMLEENPRNKILLEIEFRQKKIDKEIQNQIISIVKEEMEKKMEEDKILIENNSVVICKKCGRRNSFVVDGHNCGQCGNKITYE